MFGRVAKDQKAIRVSPIVVVGLIKEDVIVGSVIEGQAWKAPLQLHKLHVAVEQVLQWDVFNKHLEVTITILQRHLTVIHLSVLGVTRVKWLDRRNSGGSFLSGGMQDCCVSLATDLLIA